MEPLLTAVVQPAYAHALPFRVMFEELLQRRHDDLLGEVERCFPGALGKARATLDRLISRQENSYRRLQQADERLREGGRNQPLDRMVWVCQERDAPLKRLLHGMNSSALCLSGGGVRSASFSLGVLEGLARFSRQAPGPEGGMMEEFDYVSTVSGGGYITSWLMSWVYRRFHSGPARPWKTAYSEVISALAGQEHVSAAMPAAPGLTGGDPEPQSTRHLRSYSSFLAPLLGASMDTATLLAIVLRNLLVNWLMLLPLLFAAVSGARTVATALAGYQQAVHQQAVRQQAMHTGEHAAGNDAAILGCFFCATLLAALALPSHRRRRTQENVLVRSMRWRRYAGRGFVACVVVGSSLLAFSRDTFAQHKMQQFWIETDMACLCFGVLSASIALAESRRILFAERAVEQVRSARVQVRRVVPGLRIAGVWVAALLSAGFSAFSSSGLLLLLRKFAYQNRLRLHAGTDQHAWLGILQPKDRLFMVIAIPVVLGILLMTTSLLCALLGVFEFEEDREWWVRCGGALITFGLCWAVGQAFVFYSTDVQHWVVVTVTGLLLAGLSSLGGFSSLTAAGTGATKTLNLSKPGKFFAAHGMLLPAVGVVAVLLLAVGVVTLEELMRTWGGALLLAHHREFRNTAGLLPALARMCTRLLHKFPNAGGALLLFAVMTALTLLLNWAVNINLFSLQGMYRMRLMRAYLGASNVFRRPDPFTGFDPTDTPLLYQMPCAPGVPLHLLNCTLNLTGTRVSAWRQRRAEIFGFSPVACGGWRVGYVRSEEYGGRHNGTTLAAAMSISGSAFNPNMGYHTNPLLSLIMTFFNVRLGAWLPNPKWPAVKGWTSELRKERFVSRPGPLFALLPLLQELLGQADDNRAWVELTDGGHFENLALYEMVMRRCKQIVVVDAGADPKYGYEDLGNALRKIQIDLGVQIEFQGAMPMRAESGAANAYCAVATIRYGCVDLGESNGVLVYVKPVLNGSEPADIYQYARTHASFPNESTFNQFFNESQFESYRHLGSWAIEQIVKGPDEPWSAPGPAGPACEREAVPCGTLSNFIAMATQYGEHMHRKAETKSA